MKALDTNVLVRFLTGDDEGQAALALERFKAAEKAGKLFFVPLLVTLETMWVLESMHEASREDILDSVSDLLVMPILEFEASSALYGFIVTARESNYDLADLLIGQSARISGCSSVITFDEEAAKSEFFELLTRAGRDAD